jgi:hypothetical protein
LDYILVAIFPKLPQENNCLVGENLPNLVTLLQKYQKREVSFLAQEHGFGRCRVFMSSNP